MAEETAWLRSQEKTDTEGFVAIEGARGLIAGVSPMSWAIVTSAERETARIRLRAVGLPVPEVMVTEDVSAGKPDPEGYLTAARKLGVAPAECLIFEDSSAGVMAGRAAGASLAIAAAAFRPSPAITYLRVI